jgi:glutamate-ammonia-ligase adenylyltransferase
MVVYDAADGAGSDYYARLTQRLISALSAPTPEGELYEIDAKLRPSGSKGPVAVRLSSFAHYYEQEAWTWEMQALTRLRPIAGDDDLGVRALTSARTALARPRDASTTFAEVADMRARMERERPAKDFWDLKLSPGGFVDIEFLVQALQLVWAARAPGVLTPNTGEALTRLQQAGALASEEADRLRRAWTLWSDLHQVARLCLGDERLGAAPAPLNRRLAELTGVADLEALEALVGELRQVVRADFVRIVGQPVRRA